MKKRCFTLWIVIMSLTLITVQALDLTVQSKPIQSSYIIDTNEPALFNLTITNNDESDTFEIYSLVGIEISPKTIVLVSGETKTITIQVVPQDSLKTKRDAPFNFVYKIKSSKKEMDEETLSMMIIGLESVVTITPESINPRSEKIIVSIKNNLNKKLEGIDLSMKSAFFEYTSTMSLDEREVKTIEIPLDKNRVKTLNAGKYLMNSNLMYNDKEVEIETQINFIEQEDIETNEDSTGFLIQHTKIIKKNVGNLEKTISVRAEKNIISFLFTTIDKEPTESSFEGLKRVYVWTKELQPNEELQIIIKTNWVYPLIILILIIGGVILIRKSIYGDIILKKRVSFVKTHGGQFALKVSLIVKARGFVQRIRITDRLPHLVELYDKFGMIPPTHVDQKNKRLEWDVESLNRGETRIFTYIVYSKIGVVGRFELPSARAVYEKDGKLKEAISNRSFYINEPKDHTHT